jgi:sortase A
MKRTARTLGTLMIVAGVGMLAWALLVWRWEDPFTSLYTAWKQRELASQLDRQIEDFRPTTPAGASLAAVRRSIAADAARYRRSVERGQAMGRIRIPRLGLNMIVVNGTDHDSLSRGPGRETSTFMPGQRKLVYIAGHRTTYAAPFSHIDRLRPGDRVTLELPYATFTYAITGHRIVAATATWALRSHHREVLALQACHPRFFASHRYIAYARPIGVTTRGGRDYVLASSQAKPG